MSYATVSASKVFHPSLITTLRHKMNAPANTLICVLAFGFNKDETFYTASPDLEVFGKKRQYFR